LWWYRDRYWWDSEGLHAADVQALVLQRELKKQKTLERARADVFGGVAAEVVDESRPRRERIPESVRHEVWRRDQGRCVDCGSRERLEFDHIIPVSKGGSNTARNLELRCEICNPSKGAKV
jgi:5-methylcytosine-specific restriction endonuclease McrA